MTHCWLLEAGSGPAYLSGERFESRPVITFDPWQAQRFSSPEAAREEQKRLELDERWRAVEHGFEEFGHEGEPQEHAPVPVGPQHSF